MNSQQSEPEDHHRYGPIMVTHETVRFLIAALKFYEEVRSEENKLISADEHLAAFLTDHVHQELDVGRDLAHAEDLRQRMEADLERRAHALDITISLTHGSVRYLKSVAMLYLNFIKQRRNALSQRPNVTKNLLSTIDRQITIREETFATQGVFANASLMPLLAEQALPSTSQSAASPASLTYSERPKPVLLDSIEILDDELRTRCLDLFTQFEERSQSDRHDTVISEGTRILENRLRKLTDTHDSTTGSELVKRAFGGARPVLRVSEVDAEQEAVHLLFRGVFGFIRNPVHHRLISDLTAERVVQILGLIDYLIAVANRAAREGPQEGDQ